MLKFVACIYFNVLKTRDKKRGPKPFAIEAIRLVQAVFNLLAKQNIDDKNITVVLYASVAGAHQCFLSI